MPHEKYQSSHPSSAAEAWALYLALVEVAVVPTIITDCLGLLNTSAAGFTAAKNAKAANARIWSLIEDVSSGQMPQLEKRSYGCPLTPRWISAYTGCAPT